MGNGKISFNCPGCGREFNIDARLKGRKIRCSQCKRLSPIPSSQAKKRIITRPTAPSSLKDEAHGAATDKRSETKQKPKPEHAPKTTVETESQLESEPATTEPPPKQPATGKPLSIRIESAHTKKKTPSNAGTLEQTSETHQEPAQPEPSKPEPEEESPTEQQTTKGDKISTEPESASESESIPESVPVTTESSDQEKVNVAEQLQQTKQALTEMTARREQEESAYSRTIARITTQLDETAQQRDQMASELEDLRHQKQQWASNAEHQNTQTKTILQSVKQAVDQHCEAQLNGMQTLRQQIKQLMDNES